MDEISVNEDAFEDQAPISSDENAPGDHGGNDDSEGAEKKDEESIDDFYEGEENEDEAKGSASEFAQMLADSFKKPSKRLSVGDKIKGEILVIGKEEVFVSTGTVTDGTVSRRDMVGPEGQFEFKVGDKLDLFVTMVRGTQITLSPNPTSKNFSDDLQDAYNNRQPVEGRVVELCKGGLRVNIHGKIAFCPIGQIDTARTETGEEFIGKKLEFSITQFSGGGRNIVVSRRRLLEQQRDASQGSFAQERKEGDIVTGKVKRIEPFGAFVEVAPGIDGLLHISELSYTRVQDPTEVVAIGQEVRVKILKTESVEGRLKISLSLKQVGPEPWANIPGELKEGQIVPGRVTRCVKFGAFVEVAPGLEGLIPLSEMSHTKRVMRSDELIKEGESIMVLIKEMHPETKRISLSLRDAGEDPWALVAQRFPVGAIVPGKVERREPYGLFIQLEEGITGLLPKSKANAMPEFPFEKLKPGETVMIQIAELRLGERRISLDVPQDPNRDDWKGFVSKGSTGSFGTLGDQLSKVLAGGGTKAQKTGNKK